MTTPTLPLVQDPDRLSRRLQEIPQEPGVYLMKDTLDFSRRRSRERLLYIGKSKKLRSRVRSYFREGQKHSPRIQLMVRQVSEIEFIVTDTEAEALALEANLIKQHQPHFNVLLKDDKKYPYLCITWSEDYPRIFITRKRPMGNRKNKYYGPYVDVKLLRNTLDIVKSIFPQRQRPQPLFKDRTCLNYDLGKCPGVCQQLIAPETYRQTMQKIAMVFQGRTGELVDLLTAQMQQAAADLRFETAAKLRDQIAGIKSLNADQKVSLPDDTISRDAIALAARNEHCCIQLFPMRGGNLVGRLGFNADPQSGTVGEILQRVLEEHYQNTDSVEIPAEILVQQELPDAEMLADYLSARKGRKVSIIVPQRQSKAELIEMVARNAQYEVERMAKAGERNRQALRDLADLLDLPGLPDFSRSVRLEGYDISHIQGAHAIASQVVFIDGLPAKQHYRHYKIENPEVKPGHSDDFASLAEVIRRRFRKFVEDPKLQRHGNPDFPDLVIIDGGKGQLSAVVSVLQTINLMAELPVISLAKQREEIFRPGESAPLATDPEQPGVQLLRRLRDEAHRFAVSFHRQQRSEIMKRSHLDEIPGLGFGRQKQLLGHFLSIDYIRAATPQQLAEVNGIGPHLAQSIYNYFHPEAE
ncbi:MAG: excinuclease ABC subunit UvrC [Hormoscilla sp. SP12CHS1]|nr:excinuclease ABC subunit UvrC [Hormoscilla sp. SP12CHS1]